MLGHSASFIDLIPEDHNGDFLQLGHLEHTLQLISAFLESLLIACVDQIDDSINIANIISPSFPGCFMATKIPCFESYFPYITLQVPRTNYSEYGC